MPISIQCSACGQKMKAKENLAGRRVKCPKCGQPIQIPDLEPEAPESSAESELAALDAGQADPFGLDGSAEEDPLGLGDAGTSADPLGNADWPNQQQETAAGGGAPSPAIDPLSQPVASSAASPAGQNKPPKAPPKLLGIVLSRRKLFLILPLTGFLLGGLLAAVLGSVGRPSYAKVMIAELAVYVIVGTILGAAFGLLAFLVVARFIPRDPSESQAHADKVEQKQKGGLAKILGGVVMVIAGLISFGMFHNLETRGGRLRTLKIIIALYKVLGKWGMLTTMLLIGVGLGIWGIIDIFGETKSDS